MHLFAGLFLFCWLSFSVFKLHLCPRDTYCLPISATVCQHQINLLLPSWLSEIRHPSKVFKVLNMYVTKSAAWFYWSWICPERLKSANLFSLYLWSFSLGSSSSDLYILPRFWYQSTKSCQSRFIDIVIDHTVLTDVILSDVKLSNF